MVIDGEVKLQHHRILFAVSYDIDWQLIREPLSFADTAACTKTFERLADYVQTSRDRIDAFCKYRRVYQLMNAIPVGQTSKHGISHFPITTGDYIIEFREKVASEYAKVRYVKEVITWDWNVQRRRIHELAEEKLTLEAMTKIYRRLIYARAARPEAKPELRYFLSILEEVTC